jgi:LysM repeat protein
MPEKWMEDIEEVERKNQSRRMRSKGPFGIDPAYVKYIVAGGIGLLLLIFIIAALTGGEEEQQVPPASTQKTQDLNARFQAVQNRLTSLETKILQAVGNLEQGDQLDPVLKRLDALSQDVNQLSKRIDSLQAQKTPPQKKKTSQPASSPPPEKKQAKQSKPVAHEVQQGENLFRIGLKYDVSAKQIRQWNNLGPKEPIYPGQKLKIFPPSSNE